MDLDKAIKCLEKETGEIVNLDELLKDDTQWKGRAQKIEVLKSQVKYAFHFNMLFLKGS